MDTEWSNTVDKGLDLKPLTVETVVTPATRPPFFYLREFPMSELVTGQSTG